MLKPIVLKIEHDRLIQLGKKLKVCLGKLLENILRCI